MGRMLVQVWLERHAREGDSPVALALTLRKSTFHLESRTLGLVRKSARKTELNLNMTQRPIANKYCEGTLKRIPRGK